MKKYLPIAASVLLLAACSEKPGYEITGTVSNSDLNGKYVYLYEYGVKDAAPLDSALVQNGSFALKGTQNAPALRTLRFSEEVVEPVRVAPGENAPFMATFVLENGKLAVVLDSTSTVSGTPENDAQKELEIILLGVNVCLLIFSALLLLIFILYMHCQFNLSNHFYVFRPTHTWKQVSVSGICRVLTGCTLLSVESAAILTFR